MILYRMLRWSVECYRTSPRKDAQTFNSKSHNFTSFQNLRDLYLWVFLVSRGQLRIPFLHIVARVHLLHCNLGYAILWLKNINLFPELQGSVQYDFILIQYSSLAETSFVLIPPNECVSRANHDSVPGTCCVCCLQLPYFHLHPAI